MDAWLLVLTIIIITAFIVLAGLYGKLRDDYDKLRDEFDDQERGIF